ncbi:MAG: aminotransferase class I/II-fold pyridoxal phosphate-dependent enzyme [Bdellovibrionales bacterium]|nr:aminotransferase class I/II-fold pyridoxal phosphate-dependent enzyme [Bdellovibrionales bacterium]
MISICEPNLCGKELEYLSHCVSSNYVSSVGPYVNQFEKMVAAVSETAQAVVTSSGTTALQMALLGVNVKVGDLVILPSFTFIGSANAISHCGAMPLLVDINPDSLLIDVKSLEHLLRDFTTRSSDGLHFKNTGQKISAIVPVYTLGTPADMDPIRNLAHEFGIPVVADAAAAIGATYKNQPLGGLADLSVYSFNGNKTITSGAGGAIVGNNQKVLQRLRHLTTTARVGNKYDHDEIGFNYRMTNLQAAIGCAQMENLQMFVEKKRLIFQTYSHAFKNIEQFEMVHQPHWAQSASWFSGLILTDKLEKEFPSIIDKLKDRHIEARPFWKPIHLQKPYHNAPFLKLDQCDRVWKRILILPSGTQLTESEQDHVITSLKDIIS